MENKPIIESAGDWEGLYREESTRWERGKINPALRVWLETGQVPPGRILIPGCGRSPEPHFLAANGFAVTGLDFAPSAIQFQQNQPKDSRAKTPPEFLQADVLIWQSPILFDAIYDQTCLCALQPKHVGNYAEQLHKWLKPGGKLLAMFMQTGRENGPPFHCGLPEMHKLFAPAKWQWGVQENAAAHSNGKTELGYILTRI